MLDGSVVSSGNDAESTLDEGASGSSGSDGAEVGDGGVCSEVSSKLEGVGIDPVSIGPEAPADEALVVGHAFFVFFDVNGEV